MKDSCLELSPLFLQLSTTVKTPNAISQSTTQSIGSPDLQSHHQNDSRTLINAKYKTQLIISLVTLMEFTDIDPSQFLDQLNWDNEDESPRQRDESQYSCDVNTRRGQDAADNGAYPWDILLGPIDGARENEVESRRAPTVDPKDPGDSAQQRQQHQGTGMQSFPPMASYESLMSSQNQNHQQDQPHLLSHPLAMTSMSSCPSFPLSKPSNGAGNTASNANAAVCTDVNKPGSASISNSETENLRRISTMPQSSCISGTTSNATWSQLGSSQTSGSNNDISAASNNNNNDSSSSPNPLLPSWNDSMGDLMYSPLLNMGISSNTDTTNSTTNPFQCNPMNSPFGSTPHHTSMLNHHYGMAINGFHPQVNAIVNPVVLPLNGSIPTHGIPARAGTTSPGTVKTSNAGKSTGGSSTSKASKQKDKKASNERNEREQMRAKKITQLIHEIRSNMEAEGWKEEMKSKYETLSQCVVLYLNSACSCVVPSCLTISISHVLTDVKNMWSTSSDATRKRRLI